MARDLVTAKGSNKENGAVNFTLAHMADGAVNLTSITTRVFLGQQIQCTQCHDHPSNDWKQADFLGDQRLLQGREARGGPHRQRRGASRRPTITSSPTSRATSTRSYEQARRPARDRLPDVPRRPEDQPGQGRRPPRGPRQDFITEPSNDTFAKAYVNRMWGHFFGRGFVQPVDDFGSHNPPSHPELLDKLAQQFKESGYDTRP